MKMEMGQRLVIGQKCIVCKVVAGHDDDCPVEKVRAFWEEKTKREHRCPRCLNGWVAINRGDYWECRKCHRQFSAGLVCAGEDPDTLEKAYILNDWDNCPIYVYVMKCKGNGKFRDDEIANMLMAEKQKALAEAKDDDED